MPRLTDKILLVMGGGSDGPPAAGEAFAVGNGRAIAIHCAGEGARVMVADRILAAAEETAQAIRAAGHEAQAVACDVLDEGQCRGAVERTATAFGGLNLLVNNVGVTDTTDVAGAAVDEFTQVMNVNVRGCLLAIKHALPQMRKAGGGAIVNISSISAVRGVAGSGVGYDTSKAALAGLMRSAVVSAAPLGVRVNNLLPGFISSPMLRKAAGGAELDFSAKVPLGRMGSPWDIAKAAAFLLSDDAAYISGVELRVDGGAAVLL
jgi:NAD(P)-dependent dehydrogenase (short-subunit alcohol dehydrogenase family)